MSLRPGFHGRALPVQGLGRGRIVVALPPHRAVGLERHVGVDGAAVDGGHGDGVAARVGTGHHPEEAHLGIDRPEPTVGVHLHPGDVVAHGPDAVALLLQPLGRQQHGQVGLAARAGERRRDVLDAAVGLLDAEDEHVLGQPFFALGQHRGDAQGEAFLAEQHVAAVAAAHRPDRVVLGKVQNQAAVDVEIGLAVQALGELALGAERIHHLARPCGS